MHWTRHERSPSIFPLGKELAPLESSSQLTTEKDLGNAIAMCGLIGNSISWADHHSDR
ncbi:MAG: hypothetical protein O1I87_14565 [Cylindrospermopsis raciborskii PAMP2012]|uniref:hypothetical protein n=1 Tax=Cylindrospermopsis raciborskii TaxID=77022 RepID=UPI0013666AB8|nr:hypothetical protein [Cylindrospermopsis raciborskii]MCZ2203148.1 hypothetical protein [Cylindrospermopsis raciborskii PAMP2012]